MPFSLRERMLLKLVGAIPQNEVSRALGWILARPLPAPVRAPIYGAFARRYGVKLDEAERPLSSYESFDDFFTRRLKPGARSLANAPLVSPVDGVVSQYGPIEHGQLIQAKGRYYTAAALLGDPKEATPFLGGSFLTIYLSPKDYHRIHSPADGQVEGYSYLPGRLWPVNAPAVASVEGLFAQNERVATYLTTSFGRVAVVKVGATCVGSVSLAYDPSFRSNRGEKSPSTRHLTSPLPAARLDELGAFHMGSTVILLFSPGAPALRTFTEGQPLQLGEALSA
jgi:phosphatidylserine decarboxylase